MAKTFTSIDDLQAELNRREEQFQALRDQQKIDDDFYEQKDPLNIDTDAGYHEIRLGVGRALVEVPKRRLLGVPKDVSEPRKQTQDAMAAHTLRKLAVNAMMEAWMQESPNPISEAFGNLLLRGEGYFNPLPDDLAEDGALPVIMKSPDPMNLYPSLDMQRGVPRDIIVRYGRSAADVQAHYPLAKYPGLVELHTRKATDTVLWVEYWTSEFRSFYVGSTIINPQERITTTQWEPVLVQESYRDGIVPNIWGFVPFVRMFSGFGRMSADGAQEKLCRSLIFSFRDRLTALQRAASFQDSDVALHSHRSGKIVYPPGQQADAKKLALQMTTAPGKWRDEEEGGIRAEADEPPPVNQNFLAQSEYLMGSIEQEAHLSILSGYTPSNVTTASGQGMGLSWARADYQAPITNLEAGLSVAVGMVLKLLEKDYKKAVTLRATVVPDGSRTRKDVVLTPDDIDGDYVVKMRFKEENPARNDMLANLGMQIKQSGLPIPERVILEKYMGFEDGEAVLVEYAAERLVASSPELQARMQALLARQLDLTEEELVAAQQSQMAAQTPTPRSAPPLEVPQLHRGMENADINGDAGGNYPVEQGGGNIA